MAIDKYISKKHLGWLIVTVAILISSYLGYSFPIPEPPPFDQPAQLGTTNFDTLSASGSLFVDDILNIDDTDSTLSGSQTLTPAATFYEFAPATVLTLTLGTGSASAGDLLILQNTVTTNTVILDTGATVGGGNVTLGQNDLALFIFSNSKWIEVASPDNS